MKDSPVRLLVVSNVPHVRTSRFNCRDTTKDPKDNNEGNTDRYIVLSHL